MNPRKAMRAVGLAVAAIVLSVPAAANGQELWWLDHEEGRWPVATYMKSGSPDFLQFTLTDLKKEKKYGPCKDNEFGVVAELHNKIGGMGEGSIVSKKNELKTPCPTEGMGECTVPKVEPVDFPWSITLKSTGKVVISNASFTIELKGACPGSPLPKESKATGTIEGTFVDYKEEGGVKARVTFAEAGGLKVEGTELLFSGSLQFGTEFTATKEPTGFAASRTVATVDGKQMGNVVLTRAGKTIECEEATLTATAETHDRTLTVTPTFKKCTTTVSMTKFPVTVKMNGCDYLLHLESDLIDEEKDEWTFTAPIDVKCPTGKEVEIDVFTNESNHIGGIVFCRYNLGAIGNEALEQIELTNKEAQPVSWIEAHVNVSGVDSKLTAGFPFLCGAATDTAGTLQGTFELKGTPDPGEKENGIAIFP